MKTALAQRAGYLCSNPDCRRPTSGPHSDPKKALITGEAAHICAAAVGGPRYDANQTPEQRKAITNAIWLCGFVVVWRRGGVAALSGTIRHDGRKCAVMWKSKKSQACPIGSIF